MKVSVAFLLLALALHAAAFVVMKNNYFYDNDAQEYFIPHGISYQTYNQPLGQYQSEDQVEYDIREMYLNNVNSIRIDLSPGAIETDGPGQYKWNLIDHIVATAKKYNIKIFAIIGYSYFPYWSPGVSNIGKVADPGLQSMHPAGPDQGQFIDPKTTHYFDQPWVSESMSFENPNAIAYYTSYIKAIASRYKDEPTIVGWIIGNEMGYLGLWTYRQNGYDKYSLDAAKAYFKAMPKYGGDISKLNAVWGTKFDTFENIVIPNGYTRDDPSWADVVQFREQSLAKAIAKGALAVREVNQNHLISYSKVGMIFGTVDWQYAGEDSYQIVDACRDAGAPLSFFSINNYGAIYPGGEIHTGTSGIEWARNTGIPVLYTEMGYTSSDEYSITEEVQGQMIKSFMLEAIANGVIGVHVFDWTDRDNITPREYGFGIVRPDRTTKNSFRTVVETFSQIAEMDKSFLVDRLPAKCDVGFFWSNAQDQMINTFQLNFSGIWGSLTRLGLKLCIITDKQLHAGDYKTLKLLVLPRNERMFEGDLQFMLDQVISAGVNIYADYDVPGSTNYYNQPQSDFNTLIESLFGVQIQSLNAYETPVVEYLYDAHVASIQVNLGTQIGSMPPGHANYFGVLKYNKLKVTTGQALATFNIQNTIYNPVTDSNQYPAVVIKSHANAKSLLVPFNLGSIDCSYPCFTRTWDEHYEWYRGLLSEQFLNVKNELTHSGSTMIQVQHYSTKSNKIILFVSNWDYRPDQQQTVTVQMDSLKGRSLYDLIRRKPIQQDSNQGTFTITLDPNESTILVSEPTIKPKVYISSVGTETNLVVNSIPKTINVTYDTGNNAPAMKLVVQLLSNTSNLIYTQSDKIISGSGTVALNLVIDSNVISKSSEIDFVKYYYRAVLKDASSDQMVSQCNMNVLISIPVVPISNLQSTNLQQNANLNPVIRFQNPFIQRIEAFPTMIAVYRSKATGDMDASHYTKVDSVCQFFLQLGYVKNENIKDNYFSHLARVGAQFAVIDDLSTIGTNQIGKYFRAVVLPGVKSLTEDDVNNLSQFLKNTVDGLLISTEGRVGVNSNNEASLADVFGMNNEPSNDGSANDAQQVVINVNNHPITRNYTIGVSINAGSKGNAWKSAKGNVLAKSSSGLPLLIINKKDSNLASTLLLNFDITTASFDNIRSLWQGISDFAQFNSVIWKLRFQLECGDKVVDATEQWVVKSFGETQMSLQVKETCSVAYGYRGLAFNWWNGNPTMSNSIGTFASIKQLTPTFTLAPTVPGTSSPGSSDGSSDGSSEEPSKIIVSSATNLSISLLCVLSAAVLYMYL